jgi:hypothetical protein
MRIQQNMLKGSKKSNVLEQVNEKAVPARDGNAKDNFLDITVLIRSIQRAEGNPDCFLKGDENCTQIDCAWRPYCLESHRTFGKKED